VTCAVFVVFIFAGCPPGELFELKCFGYLSVSMAYCRSVEKAADVET